MKATKVVLLVVALVIALAATAMASESKWSFNMDITNGVNNSFQLGTDEAGSVMNMNQSSSFITDTAGYCLSYSGATRFDTFGEQLAITAGESRTWTVYVWVGNGYVGDTATVTWKTSTGIPSTIGSTNYALKVKMLIDPTGSYTAGNEWVIPSSLGSTPVTGLTFTGLNAIRYTQMAGVVPGKTAAFDLSPKDNGKAVKMEVTMAPEVPEPGSMLALATGLVGLAGGIIRRRR